jgi:tRNA(Arg) A34 adenosine deaminase TadA
MTELPESMEHEKWMRRCLELGERALAAGDPPVGALLVKAGVQIGEGVEAARTRNDVTCHAEIEAIRAAVQRAGVEAVRGAALYTTHEPCLMCSYVIRHYRVGQVIIGTTVPAVGGFSSAYPLLTAVDIPAWPAPPQVVADVLGEAARSLSRRYSQRPPDKK